MQYLKAQALALALALSVMAFPAIQARADALHGHHGGEVQDAGPYHFELVAKPNELTLYVLDGAGKPVEAKGAKGTAIVLAGKAKTGLELAPAGNNVLKGAGAFELASGTKVVVTVTFPNQAPVQARFTPHAGAPTGSGK
ncbi:MAG TPA: hypothetical protein VLC55_12330 [Burkholderiales bacterium]|nr:hypothetical protein [Burkholderiales bacterium]